MFSKILGLLYSEGVQNASGEPQVSVTECILS